MRWPGGGALRVAAREKTQSRHAEQPRHRPGITLVSGLAVLAVAMASGSGAADAGVHGAAAAVIDEGVQLEVARRAEGVAAASSARLTAQGVAYQVGEHNRAVAVAVAALDGAQAVVEAAGPGADRPALGALERSTATLAALAGIPLEPVVPRSPVDPVSPGTRPSIAGPVTGGGTATDLTARHLVTPDLTSRERNAQIRAVASQVFGLSLQVGAITLNAVDGGAARRAATLTVVSDSAAAAVGAVTRFGDAVLKPISLDAWPNGEIPTDLLCSVSFAPTMLLRCDAAAALVRLNQEYHAEHGTDLVLSSSYRSLAEQAAVVLARGALAAPPGRSNHGRGVAIDLGGLGGVGEFDDPDYLWLKEHAPEFGWHHPRVMEPGGGGPLEPWHWEFGDPELEVPTEPV